MTIARIRQKLEAVGSSGKTCFGSEHHGFRLEPVLSVAELAAFEQERGWTLPLQYREFVSTLGASGAGPFYGLLPLAQWDFGLDETQKLEGEAITLVDQGCGNYGLLLVTGERRGRVVYVGDEGDVYVPDDVDFFSWYERWLDEIAWDYDLGWFGVGMPGREQDFLAAVQGTDTKRRLAGVAAMFRLPRLSAESRDALVAALSDEATEVTIPAITVLAKHDRAALEPSLPALLHHHQRAVQLEALRALPKSAHAELARDFVTSSDLELARLAFRATTIPEATLVALLDGALWETAIMELRQRPLDSALPKLISLVEDEDFERRRAALVCLRVQKETRARDALLARFDREPTAQLRQEIVDGLGAMGDLDFVLAAAETDDAGLRFRAAYSLGELRDPRAIPVLERLTADTAQPAGAAWPIAEQARRALAKFH